MPFSLLRRILRHFVHAAYLHKRSTCTAAARRSSSDAGPPSAASLCRCFGLRTNSAEDKLQRTEADVGVKTAAINVNAFLLKLEVLLKSQATTENNELGTQPSHNLSKLLIEFHDWCRSWGTGLWRNLRYIGTLIMKLSILSSTHEEPLSAEGS